MKKVSKYIDREARVAEFKRLELGENSFIERVFADGVYAIIEQFPAADVAPVVRCKDCKYRDGTPGQPNILCAQMHEDDFCSYGKRKEEPHDRLQKDL